MTMLMENLDMAFLVIALPVFIVAGFPIAGWAVGAGAYVAQKLLAEYTRKKANAAENPRDIVGWMAGSLLLRGWFAAIAIFLVGLKHADAGLAAAIVFLGAFTIYFSTRMMFRGME
jgi:hypothetical protein